MTAEATSRPRGVAFPSMGEPRNRPEGFERLRNLPLVGRVADWGMGPSARLEEDEEGRRAHRRAEGHRVDLPLLRGRLRPGRLHAGRRADRHRGQPALADQPGHALPEGLGLAPARPAARSPDEGQVPAPRRDRVGGARPRDGDGHDRRARRSPPARTAGRTPTTRAAASTARWASPTSAARRSTTRRTTSSRRPSRPWARSRSRTRPAYDTPPRSPVWGPRSGAAAPPTSSRTCRTRTASYPGLEPG